MRASWLAHVGLAAFILAAGCGGSGGGGGGGDGGEGDAEADAQTGGYQIAIISVPPSGTLVNATFSVGIEVRAAVTGEAVAPQSPLTVTLAVAAGGGTLSGALSKVVAGPTATFSGLSYDTLDALEIRATSPGAAAAQSEPITFDVDIAASPTDLGSVLSGEALPSVDFTLLDGRGDAYPVTGNLSWSLVDLGSTAEVASGTEPLAASATATVALAPIDAIASYRLTARLAGSTHEATTDLAVVGYDLVFTALPPSGTLVNAAFAVDLEVRDPRTSLPVAPGAPLLVTLAPTSGAGTLGGTLVQAVSTSTASFTGLAYDMVDSLTIEATSARSLPTSSGGIAFDVAIDPSPASLGKIRPGAAIPAVTFTLLDGLAAPYANAGELDWTLTNQTTGQQVTFGMQSFGGTAMADVALSPSFVEAQYRLQGSLAGSSNVATVDFEVQGYELAFTTLPPSGTLVHEPFSVDLEIRDKDTGLPTAPDAPLQVSLDLASGTGVLSGTTSKMVATSSTTFSGLSYDVIDSAQIRASSLQSLPGVSAPIAFEVDIAASPTNLGSIQPGAAIPPVTFTLYDGLGAPYPVAGSLSWTLVDQNTLATYRTGSQDFAGTAVADVNFAPIPDEAPYRLTGNLVGSANQATSDLVITSLTLENEPGPFVALKSARVGDAYLDDVSFAVQGAFEWGLLSGSLPDGITLDPSTGVLSGTPTTPTNGRFTLYAKTTATTATPIRCALAVFSTNESEWVAGQDFTGAGPATVVQNDDSTTFTSSFDGASYTTALKIYSPTLASISSPLPMFVFHRGRGFHFLDYVGFLTHIASYGFIVVSVEDCQSFAEGGAAACSASLQYDLFRVDEGMESGSAFHEAAIARMLARNATPSDPFEGKIDETAVIVGGHSRGGGSTHGSHVRGLDLQINGAIYFMAYDLRYEAGTEPPGVPNAYAIPDVQPRLPSLTISAEQDGDVIYPIADEFIDRASGQSTSATVYGAVHSYLGDTSNYDAGGAYITRQQEQDFTANQVVAFLKRWGSYDLSLEGFLYGDELAGSTVYGIAALRNMTDPIWIDDYQDGTAAQNLLGGSNSITGGTRQEVPIYPNIGNMSSLGIRQNILTFSANNSTYTTQLGGGLDVSAQKRLVFRCGQTSATGYDWVTFRARISDGTATSTVTLFDRAAPANTYLPDYSGDQRVYDRFVQVEVPLAAFVAAAPTLDLGAVTTVDLLFSFAGTPTAAQQIYLDDLRFE